MTVAATAISVIGLGNPMAGDDGAGPRIIRRLQELGAPAGVSLECISAPGPEMVELLGGPGEVWFVDAARGEGLKPGEIIRRRVLPGDDAALKEAKHLVSTHGLSLAELLRLAAALGRWKSPVELWGIAGKSFEAGDRLSPEAQTGCEEAADRLLAELSGRLAQPRAEGQ